MPSKRQIEALLAKLLAQQDGIVRLMEEIEQAMRLGLIRQRPKVTTPAGRRPSRTKRRARKKLR